MRKVVLRAIRRGAEPAFYTTEELQDEWSKEYYYGSYTEDLNKAKVFDSLTKAFEYISLLPGANNMLAIEPMWLLEEEKTVVEQTISRIE